MTACGGPDLDRLDPMSRVGWYDLLAYAAVDQGRSAQAQEWADRADALARTFQLPMRTGFADLAQGHALLLSNPALAAEKADAAANAFDLGGDRVDAGRAHLAAALAYSAAGQTNAARERFALARKRFEDTGARWFLAQTAREERRMNARRPRRGQAEVTGIEQLTPREREIADLVAVGLTNREIADRLFLSVRTVDAHLWRIFNRLGVTNRVALAHMLTKP
jgi:DNA-binding CsgD family transcriptional regulator